VSEPKSTVLFSAMDPNALSSLLLNATGATTTVDAASPLPQAILFTPDEPGLASVALAPFEPAALHLPPPRDDEPPAILTQVVRGHHHRRVIEASSIYRASSKVEEVPMVVKGRRARRPIAPMLLATAALAMTLGMVLGLAIPR